jgi:hypothetical protein
MFVNPLLAVRAASLGSDLLQAAARNIAGGSAKAEQKAAATPAEATRFSDMLAKVAASPKVQNARLLQTEGILDHADAEVRLGEIAQRIAAESPEAREALAGSGGAFKMRVLENGDVSLHTADGKVRNIRLCGGAKELAVKAHRILDAIDSAPAGSDAISKKGAGERWAGRGVLHVMPGAGVSIGR